MIQFAYSAADCYRKFSCPQLSRFPRNSLNIFRQRKKVKETDCKAQVRLAIIAIVGRQRLFKHAQNLCQLVDFATLDSWGTATRVVAHPAACWENLWSSSLPLNPLIFEGGCQREYSLTCTTGFANLSLYVLCSILQKKIDCLELISKKHVLARIAFELN